LELELDLELELELDWEAGRGGRRMSGRQEVAGGEEGEVGEAGAGDKVRGARCGVDVGGGRCVLIMAVSRPR